MEAAQQKAAIDEMVKNGLIARNSELVTAAKKSIEELADAQKFAAFAGKINDRVTMFTSGITNILSAVQTYYAAATAARLDQLDREEKAALRAAGVAQDTAAETAQKEYDAAVASGDATAIAEKKKALTRAKIEEDFEKRKAQTQYKGNLASWQLQKDIAMVQMLQAPLNAYVSSLATPIIGPFIAPINAAVALGVASLQYAAVLQSKPKPPQFATGGIIPGSMQGTPIIAGENNKPEAVLNQDQMKRFLDIADGKQSNKNGAQTLYQIQPMDRQLMYDDLYNASKDGRLYIAARGVQA
jgi:hypothetical protein